MDSDCSANLAAIKLRNIHLVACAHPRSDWAEPFRLGPFDHLSPMTLPIDNIWIYPQAPQKLEGAPSPIIDVSCLKNAISLLLDVYYHLGGRFRLNNRDKMPEITDFRQGTWLYESSCPCTLESLYGSSDSRLTIDRLPNGGNSLLPPTSVKKESPGEAPVFALQHTTFACGSVSIGLRVSHAVCDAQGYFQLARDLAELYRKVRVSPDAWQHVTLAEPPLLESYMRDFYDLADDHELCNALEYQPSLYYVADSTPPWPQFPASTRRVIRFSGSELQALKDNASDLQAGVGEYVSTFDALCAHVFQRIHLARVTHATNSGISLDTITASFLTSKNWRSELRLGERYFGNAVNIFYFTLSHEKMANSSHSELAKFIHNAIRGFTSEELVNHLKFVAASPDKSKVIPNFSLGNGTITTTQWCKYDCFKGTEYGLDEAGRPILPILSLPPETPFSTLDGVSFFCATEEQSHATERQAIDFVVTLMDPLWEILDKDPLWRGFQPHNTP